MSSNVFFTPVSESDSIEIVQKKLALLIEKSGLFSTLKTGCQAVIKIHFGEEGNTGHIRPQYTAVVSKQINSAGGSVILSDSNTLYRGRRVESVDHRNLAIEHGFTKDVTGAEVVIADERAEAVDTVPVNLQYVKDAKIPRLYIKTDLFISMAHFKGHMMSGFGGTLKNIGMGCATREGKLVQHSDIAPVVYTGKCTACGMCAEACQVSAIEIVNGRARVNAAKCTGCAACIAACAFGAMEVDWMGGSQLMQEKMVEYAAAVLNNVPQSIHMNFATKITAECDCLAKDDPRIIDDIGIFLSADPVACDQASVDMINKKAGRDLFKEIHASHDGKKQLLYAEKVGLGSRTYALVEVL